MALVDLAAHIRNVPDWPKPGVQFKDVTTLLQAPDAMRQIVGTWKERYAPQAIEGIVAADARGFIFGAPLAYELHVPLIPVRKTGKLPAETIAEDYELEYGMARMEMHVDALRPGQRVILLDDLLATGGTMAAAARLARRLGAEIVEAAFVVELPPLGGRKALAPMPVHSLVTFMVE